MYPILFEPFGYPISTFGLMMAIGFLVANAIAARRLGEYGLDPELSTTMLLYCMLGGIAGSKLYYAIDVSIRSGAPFFDLLFAREGITWYGGLIGGTLAALIGCRVHKIPTLIYANSVAAAAAVGQGLGRFGCFLVGDDYGRPTDLPIGIAFPQGAPPTLETVHPTQLYEMLWLFGVGLLLWKRRHKSPFLFGEYLALNGLGRFFVEMLRVNPRVALGLTEPQWIAIALMVIGVGGWLIFRMRTNLAPA